MKPVDLQSDPSLVLILTATSNIDKLTVGTAIIMIENVPNIVDLPVFTDTTFWFDYSVDGGVPVLKPEDSEIGVTSSDLANTDVTLENNSGYKFEVKFDNATGSVTLTVTDVIENSKDSVLGVTLLTFLSSYPDRTSKATILVKLSSDSIIKVPQFDDPYYTATYEPSADGSTDTVYLDKAITVTGSTDFKLELNGGELFFISVSLQNHPHYHYFS